MTILSAHYAYAPNKSFIKNPLLYLDGYGKIERLESTGAIYKEVHSAQFFNGLIIPGFISDLRSLTIKEQLVFLKSAIFQHHANGTQFFIFSKSIAHSMASLPAKGPTFVFDDELPLAKPSEKSCWEQLKQTANESRQSLTELLPKFIDSVWQPYSDKLLGGAFSSGFTPGIFCISGIDWQNFRLTANPQIKPLPIL